MNKVKGRFLYYFVEKLNLTIKECWICSLIAWADICVVETWFFDLLPSSKLSNAYINRVKASFCFTFLSFCSCSSLHGNFSVGTVSDIQSNVNQRDTKTSGSLLFDRSDPWTSTQRPHTIAAGLYQVICLRAVKASWERHCWRRY